MNTVSVSSYNLAVQASNRLVEQNQQLTDELKALRRRFLQRVAYIAGPYRASTPLGILQNVHRAGDVALKYWKLGYAVICPHKNTALFDGQADDAIWLEGDKELLRRSDTVVMMAGWEQSAGAIAEHALAQELGLEIVYE